MTPTRRSAASLRRGALTGRQRDERFLDRLFRVRWFNGREEELVRELVHRYHHRAYEDVNELLSARSPLAAATLLDNYAYLTERLGGPDPDADPSPTQIYRAVPRALQQLRTAPVAVRRAAVGAARLRRVLVGLDLPDRHWATFGDGEPLGEQLAELAARHSARIASLAALIEHHPELGPGQVDAILGDRIHAPLQSGAL